MRPDLDISFSNPAGYLELLETIKAHGWELARCLGRLPSPEELGMSWLAEVYEPGLRALHEAGLSCPHEDATEADSFLWLYQRRRALWMRGARATYRDAVYDIRHAQAVATGASCATTGSGWTRDSAYSGLSQLLMRPEPIEGQPSRRLRQAQPAVNRSACGRGQARAYG